MIFSSFSLSVFWPFRNGFIINEVIWLLLSFRTFTIIWFSPSNKTSGHAPQGPHGEINQGHGSPKQSGVHTLESELSPKILCGYPRGKVTIVNLETNQPEIGRDRNNLASSSWYILRGKWAEIFKNTKPRKWTQLVGNKMNLCFFLAWHHYFPSWHSLVPFSSHSFATLSPTVVFRFYCIWLAKLFVLQIAGSSRLLSKEILAYCMELTIWLKILVTEQKLHLWIPFHFLKLVVSCTFFNHKSSSMDLMQFTMFMTEVVVSIWFRALKEVQEINKHTPLEIKRISKGSPKERVAAALLHEKMLRSCRN
jgi:hypothetical protein